MAMEMFPEDVYENINKFKDLDMYDNYGLYEAYDYDNKGVVKSYFAHHQGMSLLGITNYNSESTLWLVQLMAKANKLGHKDLIEGLPALI